MPCAHLVTALKGGKLSAASLPAWAAGVDAQLQLWIQHPQLLANGLPSDLLDLNEGTFLFDLCQKLKACATVAASAWEHFCKDLDDVHDCEQSQLDELCGVGATNCASERCVLFFLFFFVGSLVYCQHSTKSVGQLSPCAMLLGCQHLWQILSTKKKISL